MKCWIFIAIYFHAVLPAHATWSTTNVALLHDALTSGYKKIIRPSEQTNVQIEFGISSLQDLDVVSQQFNVLGFLLVSWTDSRLSWTPSSYNDITLTYMAISQVWVPPLVLNNAADGIKMFGDNSDLASVPLVVDYTGSVAWIIPGSFTASCDVDITKYPFDQQTCSLLMSSWVFPSAALLITFASGATVNTDLYSANGEWDFSSSAVQSTSRTIHGHGTPAVQIDFTFTRKTGYYIINMLLPVVLLTVLGCVVFLLPVESGEKNGFSLTILLSLSVVLSIVADSIPTTSTTVCVLSVYLLTTFTLCTLEVVVTALTVRWHTWSTDGYNLPDWLQTIMKSKLVPLVKYKRPIEVGKDPVTDAKPAMSVEDVEKMTTDGDVKRGVESPTAWDNPTPDVENYGYRDFAIVLDIYNFYIFTVLTFLINIIFFLVLVV